MIVKEKIYILKGMIVKKVMPFVLKNNISQMTTTTTPTGPYSFHKIFHNQIEVLYRSWIVAVLQNDNQKTNCI